MADLCPCLRLLDLGAIELGTSLISDVSISRIGDMCHKLVDLRLWGCTNVGDNSLAKIADGCPELFNLDVSFCNVTNRGVVRLAEKSHQLKELTLRCCNSIGDLSVILLAQNCPRLNVLTIGCCENVTQFCVEIIRKTYPALRI